MKPKISTYYPFDYQDMLSKAKYAFMNEKCGNSGNRSRPYVVLGENDELNKCYGYGISIYNNGININCEFSMPKDWVNIETLTSDVNSFICEWLINQDEQALVDCIMDA